jgi:hypothetical protein
MDGISGMTLKDGGDGCQCHNFFSNDSVYVWIEGPDTVYVQDSAYYKIFMTGGPSVVGGFDLAVYFGILNAVDTLAQIKDGDLVHSFPNIFTNDTIVWDFKYISPDTVLADTLYATGNSCNGDSIPTELDQWNHGENFIVNVVDNPVFSENEVFQPEEFVLHQNYPNPFNPSTNIRFRIADFGFVSLTVYDLLGNEVATLVDEQLPAGEHEIEFNLSSNNRFLVSGIYLYQLKAGEFVQSKKMLLLK